MELYKNKIYCVNGRKGQYELTTKDGYKCFFMLDSSKYEYFKDPDISIVDGD